MAGIPTEQLDRDIRELRMHVDAKFDEIAHSQETLRAVLTEALSQVNTERRLSEFRYDTSGNLVAGYLGEVSTLRESHMDFKDTTNGRLAAIDVRLETIQGDLRHGFESLRGDFREFKATVEFALKIAAWGVALLTPIVTGLVVFSVSAAWQASAYSSRLTAVESHQAKAVTDPAKK